MRTTRFVLLTFAIVLSFAALPSAQAQVLSSLTVEQLSAGKVGTWTLLRADGSSTTSADAEIDPKKYTAGVSAFGPHVLRVVPPMGMVSKISVYRAGELIKETDVSQYTFTLYPNEQFRFVIEYRLANLGSLGVVSELKGVIFRIKSADGRTIRGKTPWGKDLPIGRYTVYSNPVRGCFRSAPMNVEIKTEERNVVTITQTCEDAVDDFTVVRIRPSKRDILNDAAKQNSIRAAGH